MDRRRSDSVSQWVGLFSDSVVDATNLAFRIAEHVDVLLGRWRHQVLAAKMRGSSSSMRLVEFLPSNPALTAAKAADLLGVAPQHCYAGIVQLGEMWRFGSA